jgi:hypothetical protein
MVHVVVMVVMVMVMMMMMTFFNLQLVTNCTRTDLGTQKDGRLIFITLGPI